MFISFLEDNIELYKKSIHIINLLENIDTRRISLNKESLYREIMLLQELLIHDTLDTMDFNKVIKLKIIFEDILKIKNQRNQNNIIEDFINTLIMNISSDNYLNEKELEKCLEQNH